MGTLRRTALLLVSALSVGLVGLPVLGAAAAGVGSSAAGSGLPARTAVQEQGAGAVPAGCSKAVAGQGHCYLSSQPAAGPTASTSATGTTCTVNESAGYTPCNLQSAYGITTAVTKNGKANLVAVVDSYDDPNIGTDLSTYRSQYGLPPCTTANKCFKKVNQTGQQRNYPTASSGYSEEISLDVEMVSAICPLCHILLVEANSNGFGDLGAAEDEAVTLGAKVISNSWGTGEFNGENGYDNYWNHPGVDITFSSGDGAYQGGVQYPSASPYITSVGGTMLTPASSTRGWTETAWVNTSSNPPTQGSGSGCSAYEPKPPWQHDSGCTNRMTADVSAVAADVITYDSYGEPGWVYEFGTSVSSPIIAGMYGLAKNAPTSTIAAEAAYSSPTKLHDITKGSEGTCSPTYFCTAVKGYDGPTGLGSPSGIAAFKVPTTPPAAINSVSASGTSADPTITVTGSNLLPFAPAGAPEPCSAGDPGEDYGSNGLYMQDATRGWGAGQNGDCIGLVLQSYSSSQVVFGFGTSYSGYAPAAVGDAITVAVQGTSYDGTLTGSLS
jgi:Subtilase family